MALFILPFDHRSGLAGDLFGFDYQHCTATQRAQLRLVKKVIFNGYLKAHAKLGGEGMILVDEETGSAVLDRATQEHIPFILTMEKSGTPTLEFISNNFSRHIGRRMPAYVKVLVHYRVGDEKQNKAQRAKLKKVSDWCRAHGRRLMIEPLLGEETPSAATMIAMMHELLDAGIRPALWKVEGLPHASDWVKVRAISRAPIVVLGRASSPPVVRTWLTQAAKSGVVEGFAIGRTIFMGPLKKMLHGELTEDGAAATIARSFLQFAALWNKHQKKIKPARAPRVFVTRIIPNEGIDLLEGAGFTVDVYPHDAPIPRKELLKRVRGADAILSILTDTINDEVFAAAGPQLKIVANYAVGFDNIDLAAAAARNIFVTNAPGPEITEAVAEHTIALMLALSRRIVESDHFTRKGKYAGWGPQMMLGSALKGKTLGIVGLGRIGYAVAEHAVAGFGMHIVYSDHRTHADFEKQYQAKKVPFPKLLATADIVSLHVPLTKETRHLMNEDTFALMKKGSYLINTARGPVVHEKALLAALREGHLAGAALDVFECEPAIDCDIRDNLALKKCENVILTPHTASATIEARQAMSRAAAENIIAALTGKHPLNLAQ